MRQEREEPDASPFASGGGPTLSCGEVQNAEIEEPLPLQTAADLDGEGILRFTERRTLKASPDGWTSRLFSDFDDGAEEARSLSRAFCVELPPAVQLTL